MKEDESMTKRFISLALSALLLLSGTAVVSASANVTNDVSNSVRMIVQKQQEDNSVAYYDQDGNEIDITEYNNDVVVDESALPSSYDLRDENRLTPVRNQGSEGLCWDFGATASIESNILTQSELSAGIESPAYENLDLSEAGNTWYIHTPSSDQNSVFYYDYILDDSKGTNGATADVVASSLFCGFGTYPEELLPYDQWSDGYSSSLRFYSDYRLKDFTQLTYDVDLIKNKIMENGAVSIQYSCYSSNTYTTDGMEAYYDDGSPIEEYNGDAHTVAIVGWDDSFSKERFNPLMQPQSDGAWLCKNSWGEDNCSTAEGYKGYFWMSYETEISGVSQFIMQSNDEFDNIYQNQGVADVSVNLTSAANVFTAESDEILKQVGLRNIGALDASIEIYKLNDDFTSPTDGEKICQFSVSSDFIGIHMFECPTEVALTKGEVFSVVVTNKGNEMLLNLSDYNENEQSKMGFLKYPGRSWQDASEIGNGFAAIKVFTSNASGVADKTELISLIESSTKLIDDDTIDKETADEIKLQCENSQKVVDDDSATQTQVNNAYYILESIIEKLSLSTIDINSVEDYYELSDNASSIKTSDIKQINLNADLDFEGKEISPLLGTATFSGVFNGNNHKMSNFTLVNSSYSGIFKILKCAEIKDLILSDCVVESIGNAQLLAGECIDAEITNCRIENAKIKSGSRAAIITSDQSDTVVKNCSVVNTKIYGNTGAGIFFGNYVDVDSSCSYSNVDLYSCSYISDNLGKDISTYSPDYETSEAHIVSYVDNTFFIEDFTAKIASLNPYAAKVEKVTENKYKVTVIGDYPSVEVLYGTNEEDFTATGDLETRELYLTGYTGNDSDLVIPTKLNGLDVVGFDTTDFHISLSENENIKSITVPGEFKNISAHTFKSIPNLEKVTLCEGIEAINSYAFAECINLKSVQLPNSLTRIGLCAFEDCASLSDINFSEGLEVISDFAFRRCDSLPAPVMPDSLKSIGREAFSTCTFVGVTLGKGIENIADDAFAFTNKTELEYKQVYIPDFTINGYCSTAAEEYAQKYGFNFVDIENNSPAEFSTAFDYDVFLVGDVDLSGNVTIADATLIMKGIAQLVELSPVQKSNAIVGDAKSTMDIRNATLIQKYLAGMVDSLDGSAKG
jgi:C1A family cysteine protease